MVRGGQQVQLQCRAFKSPKDKVAGVLPHVWFQDPPPCCSLLRKFLKALL